MREKLKQAFTLASLAAATLLAATASAQEQPKITLTESFISRQCGMRFSYPAQWRVSAEKKCEFKLYPIGTKIQPGERMETNENSILISVVDGSFETVAADLSFEKRDGKWMFNGEGQVEAEPIRSPYQGLMVDDYACRIYGQEGYIGLGDCARAVMSDGQRTVSFDADPGGLELLPQVVKSFRFEAGTPAAGEKPSSPK